MTGLIITTGAVKRSAERDIVRRLLPVLPPLLLDLPDRVQFVGPTRTAIIDRPRRLSGELSMSKASQLSVVFDDPDYRVLRDPLFDSQVDLNLTGDTDALRYLRGWRMDRPRKAGGYELSGTETTIKMWAASDADLKAQSQPLRRDARRLNLEGWVRTLAREVDLQAVVPRPGRPVKLNADRATDVGFGDSAAARVRIKGEPASREQLRIIDRVLQVAVDERANLRPTLALVAACIVESECRDLRSGDRDSEGVLQVRVGTHGADVARSVEASARAFLTRGFTGKGGAIRIAKDHRGKSVNDIAQDVQGSGHPNRYGQYEREARRIVELWTGEALTKWPPEDRRAAAAEKKRVEWRRGLENGSESSYTHLGKLAEELGRRRFTSAGRLVFAEDQSLILAAPHMSLDLEDDRLVARPSIAQEGSAALTTLDVQAWAEHWTAPPGAVVDVRDAGPASGAWLVDTIRFEAGVPTIDVTLTQPTTQAPQTTQAPRPAGGSGGGSNRGAAAAVQWAAGRLWVRERGTNSGDAVSAIIRGNGGSPGQPWCGYFVRGALRAGGVNAPAGMASVQWIYDTAGRKASPFRGRTSAAHAKPGDLAVIGGTGTHVGLVERVDRAAGVLHTIEGNTSVPGGGQGVARKRRPFSSVTAIAQVRYP